MRVMGLGKAKDVQKLNDQMAIDLGAELLGETIIFFIAATTLYVEYQRSSMKDQLKEEEKKQKIRILENRIQELDIVTEQQEARIRELNRLVQEVRSIRYQLDKSETASSNSGSWFGRKG